MAAPQRAYATGRLIATDLSSATPTPAEFGILQDVSISFEGTEKPLYGQKQFPYDIAIGERKITGKATAAAIDTNLFNTLFFGATRTTSTGIQLAQNEPETVPAPSGPYTVQVTNHSTYLKNEGVYYAATGIPLQRVAPSSEATGKYSVNESTGTYTFAAGDASVALLFNYTYGVTTGYDEIAVTNQLMGARPIFSVLLANQTNGDTFNIGLVKCTSSKLMLPFKQQDWLVTEFDFTGMEDDSGNVATLTANE